MLDINRIRLEKRKIEESLKKRGVDVSFDEILQKDDKRKKIQAESDDLRASRKKISSEIPILKKENKDVADLIFQMKTLGDKIDELQVSRKKLEEEIFLFLTALPNIPDDDVKAGDETNNEVISTYLTQTKYDFPPKNHVELSKNLDLVDYERGVKISGEGFWIYKNLGARLEWALINFFINSHLKNGWEFFLVPHILNYDCGFVTGQFPKFEDEQYTIGQNEIEPSSDSSMRDFKSKKFIIPTAETALVNVYKNEILDHDELPKKLFSYTPCYRKESGSSRIEERGMIRGHQFNKVEMVQYTSEEDSGFAFKEMLFNSESIMKDLKLHYQVSKLAACDCSFTMCRTYDIEVWLPSIKAYKEVSSVSNCRDFQARRGNMKYRDKKTGKIKFLNTLNASGLATSRLFPAILEQYQQKDGSVIVPEVLRPYMGINVIR
ncbi:MAG: serine--tRNA ligase [Oscillospiraceae bacterium]|jgi:seryl-tRNA synthetase|nr:serine--tRNA ligase [Oscillospiraceae bacterium]